MIRTKLLVLLVLAAVLLTSLNAQTTSFANSFCGGSSTGGATTGGVIPTATILSGQTNGEQSVINFSVLIMLMMLMVTALIWMLSYVLGLRTMQQLAKVEISEVFITAIVIVILIGGFNAAAISITGFNTAGTGPTRSIYINDCAYLTQTSLALLVPIFSLNIIQTMADYAESIKISIEPSNFGFEASPFTGYNLFDTILQFLDGVSFAFIGMVFGTIIFLGFVYGLFPIFLYVGIVLRTLPWTRAAGGAFLGLYIGFYIVFPLLLHFMLAGYIATLTNNLTVNANPGIINQYVTQLVQPATTNSAPTFLQFGVNFIVGILNGKGVITSYIQDVIEPAGFTVFGIVISLIISFDFVELAGGLLGAPSLSSSRMFGNLLK
jgi:hypothetical protein